MKNTNTQDQSQDKKPVNKFRSSYMRSVQNFEFQAAQAEGIDESEIIGLREKFKKLVSESGKSPYEFLTENAKRLQEENAKEFRYIVCRLLYAYKQEVEKSVESSGARGQKRNGLIEKITVLNKYLEDKN